jgi:hypothetical protein
MPQGREKGIKERIIKKAQWSGYPHHRYFEN